MPARAAQFAVCCLLALILATALAAQARLYVVTPNLIFLPQDGVALDAATGHVRWRIGRFQGPVLTDGHGLVIYSYLAGINDLLHFHQYRVCRVRAANDKKMWCFLTTHLEDLALSAHGDLLFLRRRATLEIRSAATGDRLRAFGLADFAAGEMLPLPDDGVAVFSSSSQRSRLLTVFPDGLQPRGEIRTFDLPLHAFHGPGPGVLWYAPEAGQFVSIADPARPAGFGGGAAAESFPRAVADQNGFLIERRLASGWNLFGGLYRGAPWSCALASHAELFLQDSLGLLLAEPPRAAAALTRIRAVRLADGHAAFRRDLMAALDQALIDPAAVAAPAVALFGKQTIVLLDQRDGGIRWWRDYAGDQPAGLTAPAILAWEGGELVGLDRDTGDVLWRVRFRLVGRR